MPVGDATRPEGGADAARGASGADLVRSGTDDEASRAVESGVERTLLRVCGPAVSAPARTDQAHRLNAPGHERDPSGATRA